MPVERSPTTCHGPARKSEPFGKSASMTSTSDECGSWTRLGRIKSRKQKEPPRRSCLRASVIVICPCRCVVPVSLYPCRCIGYEYTTLLLRNTMRHTYCTLSSTEQLNLTKDIASRSFLCIKNDVPSSSSTSRPSSSRCQLIWHMAEKRRCLVQTQTHTILLGPST